MSASLTLYVFFNISSELMAWQLLAFVQFSLFDEMRNKSILLSERQKGSNFIK